MKTSRFKKTLHRCYRAKSNYESKGASLLPKASSQLSRSQPKGRRLIKITSAFALFTMVFTASFTSAFGSPRESAALEEREGKPNMVFIMTDDLDTASMARLPRLRSMLTSKGTTFSNSFVTTSLCCPSRASTLRGQYSHNHSVIGHTAPRGGHSKFRELGHETSNIATWLSDSGYRTALIGKYLNGYNDTYIPPGWDEWYAQVGYFPGPHNSTLYNDNGKFVSNENGAMRDTDILADKAIDYLEYTKEDPKPFFLYLAVNAPHQPAIPDPEHAGKFDGVRLPRPPSFNERDVSDKPQWIRNQRLVSSNDIERMRKLHRNRLETMLSVEDALERIIATLQKNGELENTYIVFTSDNGFHMGQHRLKIGKMTAYEEDIRVPLIVRGPGIPAGRTLNHMALNNDLAPTFAELGGAAIPPFVDGRSLVPLLTESPPPLTAWRTAFMSENWQVATPNGLWPAPDNFALRGLNYSYVKYASNEREMYYLSVDPYQLNSRHKDAPSSHIRHMNQRYNALIGCTGKTCRTAEDAFSPTMTPPPPNGSPSITQPNPRPGTKLKSRSARIAATVRDRETNLRKDNIALFLDGKRISGFSYNSRTDRLINQASNLSYGRHSVKIVVRDGGGKRTIRNWNFTLIRR